MRKKRLMALLLSGVMAATMFSVPVFAEEADTETATEGKDTGSDTPLVVGQTNFSEKFLSLIHI